MPILHPNELFADRYLLLEVIGSRGVSDVWRAEDQKAAGAVVALKIYAPESKLDEVVQHQLLNDYNISRALDHPNLVQVYTFDFYQGVPYLVTPYYGQGSLNHKLVEHGTLDEKDVAVLMKHIGSALHYLHTRQPAVLHQDVKPDNILLTDLKGFVLSEVGVSSRTRHALYSATGHHYTSPMAYAPPERFTAQPTQHTASDIFSFGVTLYQACTGELPWMGSGGLSLLQGAEIPYLPGPFGRVLSNIIRACLHENWEKRPTAAQLVEEADHFRETGTWRPYGTFGIVTAEVIHSKKRVASKPILIAASVLLLLLTALALFMPTSFPFIDSLKGSLAGDASQADAILQSNTSLSGGLDAEEEEETAARRPESGTVSQTKTVTPAPRDTPPPAQENTRASEQARQPVAAETAPAVETKPTPAPPKAPAYPRPTSLSGYLTEMTNMEVPVEEKEKWKPSIRKYFADDAVIHYVANGGGTIQFSVEDMLDILVSSDSASTISVEEVVENEAGKVEELRILMNSIEE